MSIKSSINDYIADKSDFNDYDDSTDLWKKGILDSLDLHSLIIFLEKKFLIKLEPHHLRDPRFVSIKGLAELIEELKENN